MASGKRHITYRDIADEALSGTLGPLESYASAKAVILDPDYIGGVPMGQHYQAMGLLLDIARSLRSIDKKLTVKPKRKAKEKPNGS